MQETVIFWLIITIALVAGLSAIYVEFKSDRRFWQDIEELKRDRKREEEEGD